MARGRPSTGVRQAVLDATLAVLREDGSRPRRRLMPREQRAASIRCAAARAFVHGGFAGTAMDDVAAEAGVTKIILYRHYATKKDIYRAALDQTWLRRPSPSPTARSRTPCESPNFGAGWPRP
jgi:Bacterial regulatory proteins, tetR family